MKSNIKRAIKLLSISMVLLPTAFGTMAKAGEAKITVNNCSTSKHVVWVKAYDHGGEKPVSSAKIHSSEGKEVHCTSSECDLEFSTKQHQGEKNVTTSAPEYFVHISDDDKVTATGTGEKSVCNN